MKKVFTVFWLNGTYELLQGNTIVDAFNKAGYSQGALRAVDFYSEDDKSKEYVWIKNEKKWLNIIES
jgi:hypothetical protein